MTAETEALKQMPETIWAATTVNGIETSVEMPHHDHVLDRAEYARTDIVAKEKEELLEALEKCESAMLKMAATLSRSAIEKIPTKVLIQYEEAETLARTTLQKHAAMSLPTCTQRL